MTSEVLDCHYSIIGSGPAIFLTHGIGASEDAWRFIVPKLSKNFTVITYDLRDTESHQLQIKILV